MDPLVDFKFDNLFPASPEDGMRADGTLGMFGIIYHQFNNFGHSPGRFRGGGVVQDFEDVRRIRKAHYQYLE